MVVLAEDAGPCRRKHSTPNSELGNCTRAKNALHFESRAGESVDLLGSGAGTTRELRIARYTLHEKLVAESNDAVFEKRAHLRMNQLFSIS